MTILLSWIAVQLILGSCVHQTVPRGVLSLKKGACFALRLVHYLFFTLRGVTYEGAGHTIVDLWILLPIDNEHMLDKRRRITVHLLCQIVRIQYNPRQRCIIGIAMQ